jgi:hypothetical protein
MNTITSTIALLALCCGPVTAFAQSTPAVSEDWRNADFNFSSRMMAADAKGNLFVLGDTVVGDYVVVKKLSAAGAVLWQATYDPAERLRGVWIAVDGGGNPVVLASMITGSSAQPSGWLTLKYDAAGTLLWANALPGPFRDPRRVAIDASGNIYVAGRMFVSTLDSVLIKYSSAGATLWTAAFDNGGAVDEPYSLALSPDGSRIGVAGISGNLFMALMYDAQGNRLWARTSTSLYAANDVAFGPGNVSYFATGTYLPQDPNPYQMAIVKFGAAGNTLWTKSYRVGDRTFRVAVDSQGNVVAAGMDAPNYYMDWITIKTDSDGNLLWSRNYDAGRNNDETVRMLALDSADAVYVTGTGGPNPGTGTVSYLKGVVVKYDSDGTPQWALWDVYANGRAVALEEPDALATLGFGYLVTTHYTQTGLPDVRPAAPTSLSARADLSLTDLTFTDNANNEFWVDVERCTGPGCSSFSKIGQTLGENATGFRDRDVVAGVSYSYRVRAVGFVGASGYSNTVVTPGGLPSPPSAPAGLAAQAFSPSQILLTWANSGAAQDTVKIERCQGASCTAFAQIATVTGTATTYTDSGLSRSTAYRYRVRAANAAGDSPYSNTASARTTRR